MGFFKVRFLFFFGGFFWVGFLMLTLPLKEILCNLEEVHLAMNGKEKEEGVVGELANRLLTDEG